MTQNQASTYKKGGKFYEGWGFDDMVKLLVKGTPIDRNKMFKELKTTFPDNQIEKEGDSTVAIYVPDNQISNVKKMAKLFNMKVAYAVGGRMATAETKIMSFDEFKKSLPVLTDMIALDKGVEYKPMYDKYSGTTKYFRHGRRNLKSFSLREAYEHYQYFASKGEKFAIGGKVGDTVVFRRNFDETDRAGVIIEDLGEDGYDVSSGMSRILVSPDEVVSFRPTMTKPRSKFLGIFEDGGRTDTRIAETILQQIGGMGRVKMMTGAYNFVALKNGVSFRIKNRGANFIKITLNGADLYDVEIGRIFKDNYKVVKTYNDVYFDELYTVLKDGTGMYFRLFKSGGKVENEGRDMLLNQLKQVHHHQEELRHILENNLDIEPWVIAKMERSTSNLSDITHYLDGRTEKYREGGMFDEHDGVKTYAEVVWQKRNISVTAMFTWDSTNPNLSDEIEGITLFFNDESTDEVRLMSFSSMDKLRDAVRPEIVAKIEEVEKEAMKYGYVPDSSKPAKKKSAKPESNEDFDRVEALIVAMHKFSKKTKTEDAFHKMFLSNVGKDVYNVQKLNEVATEYREYLIKWKMYDDYLDFVSDTYPNSKIPLYKKGGRTKKPLTPKQLAMAEIKQAYYKINMPFHTQHDYPSEEWNKFALKNDTEFWLESEEEMPYISGSAMNHFAKGGGISRFKEGDYVTNAKGKSKGFGAIVKIVDKMAVVDFEERGDVEWVSLYDLKKVRRPYAKGGRTTDDKMTFDIPKIPDYFADGGRFKSNMKFPPEIFRIQPETLAKKHWIVKVIVGDQKAKFFFERMSEVDEFINTIKHLVDEVYVSKEMHYADGGKIGFSALSRKVAKRYVGKAVAPKYQSEYGKRYDESEAKEVGDKVAGKVYWKQKGK